MNNRLIDPHDRSIDYSRLSMTDRCDLRCVYCLPTDYRDFQEHKFEFRPRLRGSISDADPLDAVRTAIALKPERHEFSERPQQVVRFMSSTGG